MRMGILALLGAAACGGTNAPGPDEPHTYDFGPFDIAPNQEVSNQCVQITLHNDTALFVNQVELTTGPGFHHSNWFFVPAEDAAKGIVGAFPGPDGVFKCADRSFDQAVAAFRGGVLFAQSTQSSHDIQAFPAGAALKIPAGSKLVTTIHLLNASDTTLHLAPTITLTPIAESAVITHLSGISFEDHALGLPANSKSRFELDCDLMPAWQSLYNIGNVPSPTPDFKLYYALAHYHSLGTGLTINGIRPDETATTIFTTDNRVGDGLGSTLDPLFDMTGYTRLRWSCDFYNNTSNTVGWGIGSNEMCVFLAFSDSPYFWAGGALDENSQAGTPTMGADGVPTYTHPCQVYSVDGTR